MRNQSDIPEFALNTLTLGRRLFASILLGDGKEDARGVWWRLGGVKRMYV